jgi:hypothetical protein
VKKLLFIIAIAVSTYIGIAQNGGLSPGNAVAAGNGSDQVLASALKNHRSGIQIEGQGTVIKILPDDVDGSRHQRFIIRLGSGQTLLVTHNIDIAQRIAALRVGDEVMFNGVYEWNSKGGIIHWTHHDPQRRHAAGWIRHGGQIYQ